MKIKNRILVTTLGITIVTLFFGCGDAEQSFIETPSVSSKEDLGECSKKNNHDIVIVDDENLAYECNDGKWICVDEDEVPSSSSVASSSSSESSSSEAENICGKETYNPDEQFCKYSKIYDLCGGKEYDPAKEFCDNEKTYVLCGGYTYNPSEKFCYDNLEYSFCEGSAYNPDEVFCYSDTKYDRCNGDTYNPEEKFCYNNSIYDLCGEQEYNPEEEFCHEESKYDLCNGDTYDPEESFCFSNTVRQLCGGDKFDPETEFCDGDMKYYLCNGDTYNTEEDFCFNNTLYKLCGESEYDPNTEFCHDESRYNLCDGDTYNPDTEFCKDGRKYEMCDGDSYNPSEQFCYNNVLLDLCKGNEFNPENQFCDSRDGATYSFVTIGTQTWMAENLHYESSESWVNENHPEYGRYYSWSAAVGQTSNQCGTTNCSNTEGKQGVCPDGWHVPKNSDFSMLISTVGSTTTAGGLLKSDDGWNKAKDGSAYNDGAGTNTYGFNAKSTGQYDIVPSRFSNTGYSTFIWSSSQGTTPATQASSLILRSTENTATVYTSFSKTEFAASVRCIKD